MGDPFEDVMGPLGVLRTRIEGALAGCGLQAVHVAVAPGPVLDGPHEVQILATLAEAPPAEDEDFNRVLREARDAELDRRTERARDELKNILKDPGGFL